MDPNTRLSMLREIVPIDINDAMLVESWSNDTWITASSVLRVCWRGDRARLERERALLSALPRSIPHAAVLDSGTWDDGTWLLLELLEGDRLDLVAPTLTPEQQRAAFHRFGEILRSLHDWSPPQAIRSLLISSTPVTAMSPNEIVGSALVPLPSDRLRRLLERSEELLSDNRELHRSLEQRCDELVPLVSPGEFIDGPVVHGDAHGANILYSHGDVSGLLDFEWARIGPVDLELEAICRDHPVIDAAMDDNGASATDIVELVGLRAGYPELFEVEQLTERLWLFQLCHEIRTLFTTDGSMSTDRTLTRLR